jgi:uncharacterized protein DUF6958
MPARDATIRTLNVNYRHGKGGKLIARDLYEAVRRAILKSVPAGGYGIGFRDLPRAVERSAPRGLFDERSASWYTTTVKLDLEARGLIERVPGSKPQRLRRAKRAAGS